LEQYKILIFVDSFLPGFKGGGPITSIANLDKLLNSSFDILICTKDRDFGDAQSYGTVPVKKVTMFKGHKVIYLPNISVFQIFKVVKNFGPDLIYLNSFFSITTLKLTLLSQFYLKKKILVAPRGELQDNALEIKKHKKFAFINLYRCFQLHKKVLFHATDRIETLKIRNFFDKNTVVELKNLVQVHRFRPLIKKKNELKIVFVSRISQKKNLHYALNLLSLVNSEIIFDIYGPVEDAKYWGKCEKIIQKLPENIKVSYKGCLNQNDTIYKMREYHCFLFPTLSENFGHVIIEAMQAGLVPIISNKTPWTGLESVNAGWDIDHSNRMKFASVINKLHAMNGDKFSEKSTCVMKYVQKKINVKKLKRDYILTFNKIIERSKDV